MFRSKREKAVLDQVLVDELSAYLDKQLAEKNTAETDTPRFSRELDYSKIKIDMKRLAQELEEKYPDGILADIPDVVEAGEEEMTFTDLLLHYMNIRQYPPAKCYKKAHIDRKLFSQIQKDRYYKPKKTTVVAFALALELSPDQADEFLESAGFAFSKSDVFDLIIQFCIERKIYNIDVVNEILCRYEQTILGAR